MELHSQYSLRKPPVKHSLTVNQPVKLTANRIYSRQLQIYLETKNWSIQDHKLVHVSRLQKKEPMLKLMSSPEVILYLTQLNRVTILKLREEEQMFSKRYMGVLVCQVFYLVVMITQSWRQATKKTKKVNSISHKLSRLDLNNKGRLPLVCSGLMARVPR